MTVKLYHGMFPPSEGLPEDVAWDYFDVKKFSRDNLTFFDARIAESDTAITNLDYPHQITYGHYSVRAISLIPSATKALPLEVWLADIAKLLIGGIVRFQVVDKIMFESSALIISQYPIIRPSSKEPRASYPLGIPYTIHPGEAFRVTIHWWVQPMPLRCPWNLTIGLHGVKRRRT